VAGLDLSGAEEAGAGRLEADRIRAGIPTMGAELDERTIPAETGLVPMTVDFTKGCYTGQELVARIDSRGGNVPRRLRGLRFTRRLEAGTELAGPDGRPAGVVTSAVADPAHPSEWLGLGYVRRGVDPSETLTAGEAPVRQVELSR
jgi:folate-binding protein YgfZ